MEAKATEQNCSCLGLEFLGRSSKIDPPKMVFLSHGKKSTVNGFVWTICRKHPETSGNMVFTHIFRAFLGLFPVACPTKVCENGINDGLEPQLIRLWCEPTVKCKDSNNFRNVKCPFSDDPRNHLPSGYLAWLYAKSPFGKCRYFFKFNISYSSISMGHF